MSPVLTEPAADTAAADPTRDRYRWVVLGASVAIVMCTGIIYAFSVFAGPLAEAHGWTTAQVMMAFAISGGLSPIPMVLGGIALDRGWARPLVLTGAALFAVGFALTGTATSLVGLYLSYGVLTAFGVGFCYATAVSNTVRFFPDRRGLAAGLVTGGVGLATVIGAPVARAVIDAVGVSAAFVRMGVVYGVVAVSAAALIRAAPRTTGAGAGSADGVAWRTMIRTGRFWLLFAVFATTLFAPVMLLSQLSGIGQSAWFGQSAASAALFVAAFALLKALGGPGWGALADRVGGPAAIASMAVVSLLSVVVLLTVHSPIGLAIGVLGLGSTLGGLLGVVPALTMTTFGPRFQGVNYAIMFVAYAAAAFVGPRVAAGRADDGEYGAAFVVALVVSAVAVALGMLLRRARGGIYAASATPHPASRA